MMNFVYIIVAILAGIVFAIQPTINGNVSRSLNHPIQASLVSFAVGTVLLLIVNFSLSIKLPPIDKLADTSWWLWLAGGAIGAFVVTVALTIQPRVGAGVWISCFIFGQLVMSMLLDHFGWFGLTVRSINPMRSLGAFLLAIGAILVAYY